jgi:two-component system NtrC family sensor kinase
LLHANEAKLKALDQLRHADRLATVGKLASGIAHELGTPLNVVGGRAKMILRSDGLSETAANHARIVVEQSARIADIIRQLLGFARASESRKQSGDLRLLIEQAAHLLAPLAKKKSVEITLGLPPKPVAAEVDQGQIHQVLTNLLVNSIQASQGAGIVSIRLDRGVPPVDDQAGTERDCAIITVSDQGPGIPEEVLPHIFEPFFTTKGVGEGTGLGLSLAWGIVQEHSGQIRAKNRDGGGAEFTVVLPILSSS